MNIKSLRAVFPMILIAFVSLFTGPPSAFGAGTFFGGYRGLDQIHADLTAIQSAYPNLVEIVDYGDSYAKTAGGVAGPGSGSVPGDDLLAIRLTNQSTSGDKPVFIFMSCLHAAEISTPEVALALIDELTQGYGSDADATWLLDHHEIWVLPITNPDGYRFVEMGTEHEHGGIPWFWRKNAHDGDVCAWPTGNDFGDSTTFGVDLNRNFDFKWGTSGGTAGSGAVCDSYYRGPSAASEPEVAALQTLFASLIADQRGPLDTDAAPDTATGLFIQLHNPFETIGSPWAHTPNPSPNQAGLDAIGGKFSAMSGYPYDQTHAAIYQMTGSAEEWVYGELGAAAFIIELGEVSMPPLARVDDTFWPENGPLLRYAAKIARSPYTQARGPETRAVSVVDVGGSLEVQADVDDTDNGNLAVTEAEYYVDLAPWQAGAVAVPLSPQDGTFDGALEAVAASLDISGLANGRHLVYVRGRDAGSDWGPVSATFVDVGPDTTAPVRSNGDSGFVLVTGTTQTDISLTTDEDATCKWDLAAGTDFSSMSGTFSTTGAASHTAQVPNLVDGQSYDAHVRCQDLAGNANDTDFTLAFSVAAPGELTAGLIGYWPLDETTGTSAADASGHGYDGDLVGAPVWGTGSVVGGLTLDGVNDAVLLGRTPRLDRLDTFTLSAWIRHPATSDYTSIVDKRDANADGYDLYINNTSRLFMRVNGETMAGGATVADGTWHHVAGVYDGAVGVLYVDGVFDHSTTMPGGSVDTTSGLRLGENWNFGAVNYFGGDLDEVRIYERALSANEILELYLYTNGPPPPDTTPPVRSSGAPSGVLAAGTTVATLSLTTDETADCAFSTTPGTAYAQMIAFTNTGGTAHSTSSDPLVDGQAYTYHVRCADGAGNANTTDFDIGFSVATPGPSGDIVTGLIGHWPLDDGAGTTAADASGNGYNGSLVAGLDWTTGQVNGALDFGGADPSVVIPSAPLLDSPAAVTLATWVKSTATGWHALIDKRDDTSDGYDIYLQPGGRLFFRVNNQTLSGNATVADGSWHHVVGTYDGDRLTVYVDGAQDATRTVGGVTVSTTTSLRLGQGWSGGFPLTGSLDDVRVYNRALSADDVTALHAHTGGPPPPDTTPPTRSAGAPTGTLPAGTTLATLSLSTHEDAECRYSQVAGIAYDAMTAVFTNNGTSTGGTSHSVDSPPLVDDTPYTFHVRCQDNAGNPNTDDYDIVFSVAAGAVPDDILTGLIGHWPLDDGSGTTAADASGNLYNASVAAGQGWTTGQVGGAFTLGGSDTSIVAGAAPLLDNLSAFTVAAWIRGSATSSWHAIVDKRDGSSDGFDLYVQPGSRLFLRANNQTLGGNATVADGSWHHVVGTYDGDRLDLYVDGVPDTNALVGGVTLNTSNVLRIGEVWGTGNFFFTGTVDDVRVYNRALTAGDVAALHAHTGGPPLPDTTAPVRSNGAPAGTLTVGTTQATLAIDTDETATCRYATDPGIDYTAMTTFATTDAVHHEEPLTGLVDGGIYTYHVRCQDLAGNFNTDDTTVSFAVATGSSAPGLVAHWTLDETSGTVAGDASGFGHHGQVSGGVWIAGQVGGALSLVSSGPSILAPGSSLLNTPQALTLAAWIRHGQVGGSAAILDKRDDHNDGYDLYISERSQLLLRVNGETLEGTTPIDDDAWHHVAGVWDGSRLTLYVDGQAETSQSIMPTTIDVDADVYLARNFFHGSPFNGDLDDVRIYDTALGPEEILALTQPTATTVTPPTWPDRFVIQRVGTAADVSVSGAYAGGSGAIEAQVLVDATGLPLAGFEWAEVDTAPSGGLWSGTLSGLPQGGWYRLETRRASDPGNVRVSQRFGVGVVIAALGQSNMVKMFTEISFPGDGDLGTVAPATPDNLTRQYGYGTPRISETLIGGYTRLYGRPFSWSDVTGVGATRLANNLAAELNLPVLLLDFAIDGTSIGEWTDTSWIEWQRFATAFGDIGDLEAVVWHQGRRDVELGTLESTYLLALDTLTAQISALLPPTRTLKFVSAIQNRGDYGGNVDPRYNWIRKAQLDWIAANPNAFAAGNSIDTDLATNSFGRGDGHCTASQYELMGDRYSRGILQAIGQLGFEAGVYGGAIAGASLSGTVVTVTVAQDQGTALQVLDPASDVEGFELSVDGFATVLRLGSGISSAVISPDGQTALLTLDSAPVGTLELRYLYGQNVYGYKATVGDRRANGNPLYDNFAYHLDRPGLPINQTTVSITVQ